MRSLQFFQIKIYKKIKEFESELKKVKNINKLEIEI